MYHTILLLGTYPHVLGNVIGSVIMTDIITLINFILD